MTTAARPIAGRGVEPRKTVLQLGGGRLMVHSVRLLQEGGFRVGVVDRDAGAPAFGQADAHAVIDVVDAQGVAGYARSIGADLILAVNEAGVLSAAEASGTLGLPGLTPQAALNCLDKGRMRECWEHVGLPQPSYRTVDDPDRIGGAAADLGYPVMLKPALNWGSRGVSFVAEPAGLPWAIDFARGHCRNGRYVVERCVSGTEMTLEGLVQRGRPQVLAKSDKMAQDHPRYRVAMALNYPARFPQAVLDSADQVVARAALALGIENGAFHCECMVNDDGVFLLEMGARGGGGHIFGQIVEAVSGVCMPVALVRVLLGDDVDIRPRYQKGACYRFFAPPAGVFRGAEGVEEARCLPGILDLGFQMAPGTVVGPIAGDADRPGFVVSVGATREEAVRHADRAIHAIRFVMESLPR